ncbi:hypothetical protein NIIDMKKI_38110 [Mycobacterium kansasii]|uniref:Uncharacterized protein n=1 Tax=Mycobacterium kansasii TaxID=1768 RepID=A0A7G1IFS3_MYCKA|nr:hypothetical protein NIIDMKKI_38110 [Mycobacterium kansasii]
MLTYAAPTAASAAVNAAESASSPIGITPTNVGAPAATPAPCCAANPAWASAETPTTAGSIANTPRPPTHYPQTNVSRS